MPIVQGKWKGFASANSLAFRELEIVRIWVESLADIVVAEDVGQRKRERELILQLRRKICKIYGLKRIDDSLSGEERKASYGQFMSMLEVRMSTFEYRTIRLILKPPQGEEAEEDCANMNSWRKEGEMPGDPSRGQ